MAKPDYRGAAFVLILVLAVILTLAIVELTVRSQEGPYYTPNEQTP